MIHTVDRGRHHRAGPVPDQRHRRERPGQDRRDHRHRVPGRKHPGAVLPAGRPGGQPVFQSWYDPADPRLDVAGFTQRITLLGGAREADRTAGGVWHLREARRHRRAQPVARSLPIWSCPIRASGPSPASPTPIRRTLPRLCRTGPGRQRGLRPPPQSLDYSGPVEYRSNPASRPWTTGPGPRPWCGSATTRPIEVTLAGGVSAAWMMRGRGL